jgi:hypothetical protein
MTFLECTWYDVYCKPLYGCRFSELPVWAQAEIRFILEERKAMHEKQDKLLAEIGERLSKEWKTK